MIISRLWISFLLAVACASTVAWLVALMHERGIRPLRRFWAFIKRQPKVGQVLLVTFFIVMWVMAGTKPGGGAGRPALPEASSAGRDVLPAASSAGRDVLPEGNSVGRDVPVAPGAEQWADFAPITSTNTARTLTAEDFARGFVMTRIGTGEAFDFAAPSGATVCADWEAFGAAEDWFYLAFTNWVFRIGTNEISRLRVFSFGQVDLYANQPYTSLQTRVGTVGDSTTNSVGRDVPVAPRLWPLCTSLGVVPRANWPRIAGNGNATADEELAPSRFWHCVTPSNTLQMTWQNALLGRATNAPVSFQAELWPEGRFMYRYDLSRCGGAGRPALPKASSAGRDVLPKGNSAGRNIPVAPNNTLTNVLVGAERRA